MRIDAHQHYWQIDRNGHKWPTPDLPAIHRDFLPRDLRSALARHGVGWTVAVQSQPADADTDWLLELAATEGSIGAVVGWVDVKLPEAPSRIHELATRPKLRGLRPMLQDLPPGWILDSAAEHALEAMTCAGLVLDALIRPMHLPDIAALADRWPTLTIVIDHGAKPDIASADFEPWASHIREVASRANIVCKFSGLVTEAGQKWSADCLVRYAAHLLDCFGPNRLLWGSDWPVLTLASSYDRWVATSDLLLAGLANPERNAVLGGNARRVYGRRCQVEC